MVWSCPSCTYENCDKTFCTMCDNPRPGVDLGWWKCHQRTCGSMNTAGSNTCGRCSKPRNNMEPIHVVLLGNAGTGKSFLLNCLVEQKVFESKYDPQGVTKEVEVRTYNDGHNTYHLYNIPGLLEADLKNTERNKGITEDVFRRVEGKPTIVVFVAGLDTGRVGSQDVDAFKALLDYVTVPHGSLAVIGNKVKVDDVEDLSVYCADVQRSFCQFVPGLEHALFSYAPYGNDKAANTQCRDALMRCLKDRHAKPVQSSSSSITLPQLKSTLTALVQQQDRNRRDQEVITAQQRRHQEREREEQKLALNALKERTRAEHQRESRQLQLQAEKVRQQTEENERRLQQVAEQQRRQDQQAQEKGVVSKRQGNENLT
eukprot:PhF_6_TR27812/c0_g1_i2/m.40558